MAAEEEHDKRLRMCSSTTEVPSFGQVCQHTVPKLTDVLPSTTLVDLPSPLIDREERWPPKPCFVAPDEQVLTTAILNQHADSSGSAPSLLQRAGATERIHLDPSKVVAAIVTCGGLCPGLNTVIREIVMCLRYTYGVHNIWGIRNGYRGFYSSEWEPLTPAVVSSIHKTGGTYLGSSRGGFDADKILGAVASHGANVVFVIGGDGTHRGALKLVESAAQRKMPITIAGVPKTIDCDIPLMQQTFGFATAVAQAQQPIDCAHTEARSRKCVSVVQLMGRQSGFIALSASLASRDVNACLIPEAPWSMANVNTWLEHRLSRRDHAVVVVAEGATCPEMKEGGAHAHSGTDASGNPILADVGEFIKSSVAAHFKQKGKDMPVKFICPTYTIRSCAPNATDSNMCSRLAVNAVHGAFAGRTAFTVGIVDGRDVLLPIAAVASLPPRTVDINGQEYTALCLSTGQPDFSPGAPDEQLRIAAEASARRKGGAGGIQRHAYTPVADVSGATGLTDDA